jgi:hypothetical protein
MKRHFAEGTDLIDAARFTWNGFNGYAEASDLYDLRVHQVWNDSCDEGFTIVEKTTHTLRTFVKFGETRDSEGDLQASVFVSINDNDGRIDRPAARLSITLFND